MDVKRRHIKNAFGLDFNCLERKLLAGQSLCVQLHYDNKLNFFLAKRLRKNLDSVAYYSGRFPKMRKQYTIYPETVTIRFFSYISVKTLTTC